MRKASADLALEAEKVVSGKFSVGSGKLLLKATKRIDKPGLAPFAELESDVSTDFTDLRADTFAIDALTLRAANRNEIVTLHALDVRRAENTVTAQGTWRVPRDFKDASSAPVDAQFAIKVPKLADFGIAVSGQTLAGHLDASGVLKLVDKTLAGGVTLEGGDFQLGEFHAQSLAAKIAVADNVATLGQFEIRLGGSDRITATGKARVLAPFPYEGATTLDINNLAALQPLLAVFGMKQTVAGALHIEWSGTGEAAENGPKLEQSGTFAIALAQGRFDKTDLSTVRIEGLYTPAFAQTTELHIASGLTDVTGVVEMKEGKLRLRDINLVQSKLTVLTGFLILPIDLENPKALIPLDGRLAANLNATRARPRKASRELRPNLPGQRQFHREPRRRRHAARAARASQAGRPSDQDPGHRSSSPADLALDLHYSNKELTLSRRGETAANPAAHHQGPAPARSRGDAQEQEARSHAPARCHGAASRLLARRGAESSCRRCAASTAPPRIDLRVAGTVEKPVFSGSAAIDLKGARMVDREFPALGAFRARLGFAKDTLTLNTFDGELGGGTFKLGGTVRTAEAHRARLCPATARERSPAQAQRLDHHPRR